VVDSYEKQPPTLPVDSELVDTSAVSPESVRADETVPTSCDVIVDSVSCYRFDDAIYVSKSATPPFAPFAIVAALVLFVLLQGLTGATVGKFLVGLRVVDRDGRPPGLVRAAVRTGLLVLDACPWVVPLLGWAVAATHPKHRRLGDLAAGTMVVRRRALPSIRR